MRVGHLTTAQYTHANFHRRKQSPELPTLYLQNHQPLLPEFSLPEERRRRRGASRGVAGRRRRFPLAARYTAVNSASSWQERPPKEGRAASGAAEAGLGRVPVLTLVRHLPLIDADRLPAAVAVLGEGGVEAPQTVRPAFPHHVPLTAELQRGRKVRQSREKR